MKKNLYKIFAIVFAMGILITSCDNVSLDTPQIDDEITQDNMAASKTVGDVFGAVNDGTSAPGKATTSCAIVEYVPIQGTNEYTMKITYPETGCLENGVLKTGIINVSFTGRWGAGVTATITFENYAVDAVTVNGTITATYDGLEPYPTFTVVATGMSMTFEGGKKITWASNNTYTMLTGIATPLNKDDDSWKISGSSEGTARSGKTFSRTETDLLTSPDCKWFVGGMIELTIGADDVYKMTFGETCGSVEIEYKGFNITRNLNE